METKWLEDLVSLAETRSFSRSAQLRHVTQPAFSRRIQSLEAWAGADLVDRSSYPTRLTAAGQTLYAQALELLHAVQTTRAILRAHATSAHDVVEFAVPHTLAFTFFPGWITRLKRSFGPLKSRLIALNVHDAVLRLMEGSCDVLIAYHHAAAPNQLDTSHYDMVCLGEEVVAPYVRTDAHGRALYLLPGKPQQALPYLAYAQGAYLGQMVELMLKACPAPVHFDRVYETDMAEGLKAMALEGHGVAFLPHSAVRRELRAGKLVSAAPPELASLQISMQIRAYRQRQVSAEQAGSARAQALWAHLQSTAQAC